MSSEFYKGLMAADMQDELPCPSCGERTLRYAGYDFKTLFFVCDVCNTQFTKNREHLQKRVLYLDQWAISLMHKGADGRADLDAWREVLKHLSSLARNQSVVCPYSVSHQVDSQLDSCLADDLEKVFRHLAQGLAFRHHHEIEIRQVSRSLRAFQEEADASSVQWLHKDAFRDDPNEPGDDIVIHIPYRMTKDELDGTRSKRDDGHAKWTEICRSAKPEEVRDIESLTREHSRGFGDRLFRMYLELVCRRERMWAGEESFDIDYLTRAVQSQEYRVVETVVSALAREVGDVEATFQRTHDYLLSEHFAEMPSLKIGSLLIAAVERKTVSGRKPTKTDAADINMIRHYTPYCDAMLVDNAFRGMATEAPVNIDERYGCRLFSARTRDEFEAWLCECENAAVAALEIRQPDGPIPDERIGAKLREKFGKVLGLGAKNGSEKAE